MSVAFFVKFKKKARDFLIDAFWVFSLRVLRQVMSVLVVAIVVRFVTKETFGQYQFAITLMGIAAVTALPGMQRAIIQSVARGFEGTFRIGTRLTFLYSLLGGAFLLLCAGWFAWQEEPSQAWALVAAGLVFPFSQGLAQWQSLQIGRREYRANTVRTSIGVIGAGLMTILAVVSGLTAALFLVIANYGVLAIQNLFQQRKSMASIPADAPVEQSSATYALRTSAWEFLNTFGNYVDRLLVFSFGSVTELAIYAVASRLPEIVRAMFKDIIITLIPRFAIKSKYTKSTDIKLTFISFVSTIIIIIITYLFVPMIVRVVYTDVYAESIVYCQLIMISVAIGLFGSIKNAYINSKLDIISERNISVISSAFRIISSVILVWYYGMLGAAISTILYRISIVILVEYHIRKYHLSRN